MNKQVLGFTSFADMYSTDPFFGCIYREAEQKTTRDTYVCAFRNVAYAFKLSESYITKHVGRDQTTIFKSDTEPRSNQ